MRISKYFIVINSHPTPLLQRPLKDSTLNVTFPWMYGQRDDRFMIRNKNLNINMNSISLWCFLPVFIGNRKSASSQGICENPTTRVICFVLFCFLFCFLFTLFYDPGFCIWGPAGRILTFTDITLWPCLVMVSIPSSTLKHLLDAQKWVLRDRRKGKE